MDKVDEILVISGGEASRGNDLAEKTRYARDTNHTWGGERMRINAGMLFTNKDLKGVTILHHDPLVIIPTIDQKDGGLYRLLWVLVDMSASVDVLY